MCTGLLVVSENLHIRWIIRTYPVFIYSTGTSKRAYVYFRINFIIFFSLQTNKILADGFFFFLRKKFAFQSSTEQI